MKKWEYDKITLMWRKVNGRQSLTLRANQTEYYDAEVWDYVDARGEQGWELVSVVPEIDSPQGWPRTEGYSMFFKRPIDELE